MLFSSGRSFSYSSLVILLGNFRRKGLGIIADNLSKAGWSCGCVTTVDPTGKQSSVTDAHRGGGKRFIVRVDEKLSAFLELESAVRAAKT